VCVCVSLTWAVSWGLMYGCVDIRVCVHVLYVCVFLTWAVSWGLMYGCVDIRVCVHVLYVCVCEHILPCQ
jgi:hypothetical protein